MSADTTPANVQAYPGMSCIQSSDDVTFGASSADQPQHRYVEDRLSDLEVQAEHLRDDFERLAEISDNNWSQDDADKGHIVRTLDNHRVKYNRLVADHRRQRTTVNHNARVYNSSLATLTRKEARAAFFRARDAARLRMCGTATNIRDSAHQLSYLHRYVVQVRHGQLP